MSCVQNRKPFERKHLSEDVWKTAAVRTMWIWELPKIDMGASAGQGPTTVDQ